MLTQQFVRNSFLALAFITVDVSSARSQVPLNFIALTPCRIIDTRNPSGPFGGPSLAAGSTRNISVATSSCNIPANAAAYSLNITIVVSGTPVYVVTVWPSGQTKPLVSTMNIPLGQTTANAAIVPAGTAGAINVYVSDQADLIVDINGVFVLQTNTTGQSTALGSGASSAGVQNTAVGYNVLQVNNTGSGNTAIGSLSLSSNSSGNSNVAIGSSSMQFNSSGGANTAIGALSLLNNLIGVDNTSVGFSSLSQNVVGSNNTAEGTNALSSNTTGSGNTASGSGALSGSTLGSWNVGLGSNAGAQVVTGSYNVEIANQGQSTDSNVIRIGDSANQTAAYIAGIDNVNIISGSSVLINSNGQLGTVQSSRRYKEDIHDMGSASDALMQLRPVTFRYKQASSDGSKPLQYGLIGEEVERVFPELVVYGKEGAVESVAYHELPALLLNELQYQHRTIRQQELTINRQARQLRLLQDRITALEKSIQGGAR